MRKRQMQAILLGERTVGEVREWLRMVPGDPQEPLLPLRPPSQRKPDRPVKRMTSRDIYASVHLAWKRIQIHPTGPATLRKAGIVEMKLREREEGPQGPEPEPEPPVQTERFAVASSIMGFLPATPKGKKWDVRALPHPLDARRHG